MSRQSMAFIFSCGTIAERTLTIGWTMHGQFCSRHRPVCPDLMIVRVSFAFGIVALLFLGANGCDSDTQNHTRILGGHLRTLQKCCYEAGYSAEFNPTNYIY